MSGVIRAGCLQANAQVRPDQLGPDEVDLWQKLRELSPALEAPFYTPTFASAVYAAGADAWVARIIDEDGSLIGFAPFQMRSRGEGVTVGDDMANRSGPILIENQALTKDALLSASGLSSFSFSHIPVELNSLRFLDTDVTESSGLRINLHDGAQRYFELLRDYNRPFLKNVEKRERKLAQEVGPLRFEWSSRELPDALARLIEVKRLQYSGTGVTDALRDNWRQKLLYILLQEKNEECKGVLSTLWAGNTWVASTYNLRSASSLHGWFPAYNPSLTTYGPGHLIRFHVLRHMAAEGLQMFDFGQGLNSHKKEYLTEEYALLRGFFHASSLRGYIHKIKHSLRWRLRSRTVSISSAKTARAGDLEMRSSAELRGVAL